LDGGRQDAAKCERGEPKQGWIRPLWRGRIDERATARRTVILHRRANAGDQPDDCCRKENRRRGKGGSARWLDQLSADENGAFNEQGCTE
jgi:hypothetical protein